LKILLKSFFITILLTILISCGSSSHKKEASSFLDADLQSCDQISKNRFIYSFLQDGYYWADEVPKNLDVSRFDTEEELLNRVKNSKDRFSFIIDLNHYSSIFESSSSEDFGIMSDLDEEKNYRVIYVAPNSPAYQANIKRSDRILNIGEDSNDSIKLRVIDTNGSSRVVELQKSSFLKKEVGYKKIFIKDGIKVGYFVLNSFVGKNINSDLDNIFRDFKDENIDELIIDLRYNGGGNIDISAHLASLISGKKSFSHIFQHHIFNQKYSSYNNNSYFDTNAKNALNLDRVFVITTHLTASASESLISALRANENKMKVITIGSTSYGKPYSMYSIKYCDKVFFPILMKNFNTDYDDDYDDGFEATCSAVDDKEHNFGDMKESSLDSALYYITHGSCK